MRYFLPCNEIDWSNNRWQYKNSAWVPLRKRKGYIGLFDRNVQKFIWFRIIGPDIFRHGYFVERRKPPSMYWRDVIKAEPENARR